MSNLETSICATLSSLTRGGVISPRILVVLAHPDDEVLAVGGRLEWLIDARFLCVTDGVPLDGRDAHHHGFAGLDEYRIARREEMLAAFHLAGLHGATCSKSVTFPGDAKAYLSDQTAAFQLIHLTRWLVSEIREFHPEAILSHPYEGGHPDHDACAFAAHAAVQLLANDLPVVEAPFYHAGASGVETGEFLAGGPVACTDELSALQQSRKRERMGCFVSQQDTLRLFRTEREQYRLAPAYDFTHRPHEGALYYEGFSWGMRGERFCELATEALQELGLRAPV